MPNRIIKETIRTSKSVNALSDFEFRLWLYLITYVDDFGRGSADPEIIKGFVFPKRKGVTESQIEKTLSALANTGMIVLYEVDGDSFFYFPNWASHQRIQTKVSKFPDPCEDNISRSSTVTHGEPPLESNTIQYESNTNPNTNTKGKRAGAFVPPTLKEVEDYCRERNSTVNPKQFYDYFSTPDDNGRTWIDSKGKKVTNWKQKILTWEKYDKKEVNDVRGAACESAAGYHIEYDV